MDVVDQSDATALAAPPSGSAGGGDGDGPVQWDVQLVAAPAEEGEGGGGATLALPRLVGVDLPVLCTRPPAALRLLGGGERVAAACKGEARKLHFHFRPEDELSVPLTSHPRQTASRLLLRVRVQRQRGAPGKRGVVGAEVVGAVPAAFRFGSLADFQYLTLQSFVPAGFEAEAVSNMRVRFKDG